MQRGAYQAIDKRKFLITIRIMIKISETHDQNQIIPQNKLQRLAFMKGIRSASTFALRVSENRITSYGTAYAKWNGRAGNTQYNTLLAIAKFLGESTVEKVFDP